MPLATAFSTFQPLFTEVGLGYVNYPSLAHFIGINELKDAVILWLTVQFCLLQMNVSSF